MAGQMWFGNEEFMQWVPCPAIDMGARNQHWTARSDYLNGGIGLRRSAVGAMVYEMDWNLTTELELNKVQSYFAGAHGGGPFYFLDPQAMRTNVFPAAWAQPRVAFEGGAPLLFDQKPTLAVTPTSGLYTGNPKYGAQYIVTAESIPETLTIPLPPGYLFVGSCHQNTGGGATVQYSLDGGAWADFTTTTLTAAAGGSFLRFRINGTGYATVYHMQGVVATLDNIPDFVQTPLQFVSGVGNSGVEFEAFDRHVYSAALDKVGASAVMVEVGSWR